MKRIPIKRFASCFLLLAMLFTLCACAFSYEKANLKRYVSLSREDYYGLTVKISSDYEVKDGDVDEMIGLLRLDFREKISSGEETRHAQWGDTANIYYCFTLEEDGLEVPIAGLSNMTAGATKPLIVGSETFPTDFENGLTDHAALETTFSPLTGSTATVADGDVLYLDFSYRFVNNGKVKSGELAGVRLDLSAEGEGIAALRERFVGMHPGDEFDFGFASGNLIIADFDGDGENEELYFAGNLVSISRGEKLGRIEGTFPDSYSDPDLAGKTAFMYYAIDSVDGYTVPELSEEMIAENFPGFTATTNDPVGEFRTYVLLLLKQEMQRQRQAAIEDKIWEALDALDCVKKYPRKALREEIATQKNLLENQYEYYGQLFIEQYGVNPYTSVEDFGYDFFDLTGSGYSDVWEYIKEEVAKKTVRQKLIIYRIADIEGWNLTDAEFDEAYPAQLSYYAQVDGISEAEVLAKYGGEAFFREAILYDKVMRNLVEATIVE